MPKKQCMESFKLFGVQIHVTGDNSIRKSKSLNNLHAFNPENVDASGYLSDELIHQSSKERKKGKAWTEDEHRSFLLGLEKLGKGNWKAIATNFVPSRDSSQVASHAQKYFIRIAKTEKKRRRHSVFDIPLNEKAIPGSSSNKPAESSQNNGEFKETSLPAPVVASERPPLSPTKSPGIPYMPRVSVFARGVTRPAIIPTITWVPTTDLSTSGFSPGFNGVFTTCATYVPQPSTVTFRQGSSQPAPATKSDELNLNIRKLTL